MTDEQTEPARCDQDGCVGVRLATTTGCLAHAAEQASAAFDAELTRIGVEGTVDARGVVIRADLLDRLLTAAPEVDGRRTLATARFDGATFQGQAEFHKASFQGIAWFDGATFEDDARFSEAGFQGGAWFRKVIFHAEASFRSAVFQGQAQFVDGVRFHGEARFNGAKFLGEARFKGASFQGEAGFDGAAFHRRTRFTQTHFKAKVGFGATFLAAVQFGGMTFPEAAGFNRASFLGEAGFAQATFQQQALFDQTTFHDRADFDRARFEVEAGFTKAAFQGVAGFEGASFQGNAVFEGASFQDDAVFDRASFQQRAWFDGAHFQEVASFSRVSFERARQLGSLLARQLVLDGAVFRAQVQLAATAAALCARQSRFPAGMHLRLRYATVVLDDADLAAPVILAGAPTPFPTLEEQEKQFAGGWPRLPPGPRSQRWRPRVLSIRRADVAGLHLADVDLRACRFAGAVNLDRLRIEGALPFARTPGRWRARRKTLAEEQHWRASRPGRWRPAGWYPQACQPPASPQAEAPEVLEPARLAALYRELRKGREDAKDEPGAADFYYGECEMRRHDPRTAKAERLILWAYWLLSGYALRAWRAFVALAAIIMVAGTVLAFWGFPDPAPSFRPAAVDAGGALVYRQQPLDPPSGLGQLTAGIRFSARSATALLRGPDRALTPLGEWLEISLRFVGPLLLGLAVLSMRGRVRR